ncbi:Clp protease/crotonase-like domain-containing protein [Spirosoma horti]
MNRFFVLLLGLLVRVTIGQAQSTFAVNTVNPSGQSATTGAVPHKAKATEAPFYVKVYGLYGLITPGVQISHSELQSSDGSVFTFKTATKGLGAGPRAGIGLGVIVSDFINLGIDADILFGSDLKIVNSYTDGKATYGNTETSTLKVVSVIPNITFKALSRPAYYIYNRLGLVGGVVLDYKTVSNSLEAPTVGVSTTYGSTSNYTKNSLALGYQAALGIQFRLSQAVRGFVEIVAYNQTFKPERLEFTSKTPTTTQVTVTEYKDQGVEIPTTNPTTRKPQTGQLASFTVPMNSISVGAGLAFRF